MNVRYRHRYRVGRISPLFCTSGVVAFTLLTVPAGAFGRSKLPPPDQKPPDTPLESSHWWDAVQYLAEGNFKRGVQGAGLSAHTCPEQQRGLQPKGLDSPRGRSERFGHQDLAFKAYLRAWKQFGKNEDAFLRLGDPYLWTEDPKAAIAAYSGVVGMDGASVGEHPGLAAAFLAMGPTKEAATEIAPVVGLARRCRTAALMPFRHREPVPWA